MRKEYNFSNAQANPYASEFAEQILDDLMKQGLRGEELLTAFEAQQKKIRPAVETIIAQAGEAAKGNGDYENYGDVFGSEA